ncbi:hypothetical protein RUM43_006182 [Polyplax serrata]|uniref:AF4/FMR2 family member lilli n=1 Tax=Polyplax serrata TaxID=468196 RepID=A0AAN8S1Z4_POLSC
MSKQEVKEQRKILLDYGTKVSTQPVETICGGHGTPSPNSPTPSPAGSVGSVGSQSSGYSSGELRAPHVPVPVQVHSAHMKQTTHFGLLLSCHDLWDQADQLVYAGKHKDFFIELERDCGPLTLHSSLNDLVRYVRKGIQRLKNL